MSDGGKDVDGNAADVGTHIGAEKNPVDRYEIHGFEACDA
jgi:hypothetical protein